ncbi:MAG: MBL fold metallo-hydrolase [Gammaproteobacteria bacterium]|jgi:glyoxylase-like metal-dependent hydrolase (beta-lactamase superfamily II)|nr:MBL fold metallo-hydrolase [Gammaproteobacteria bacterium]MBT6043254.1 MBL fold metallo-hydrolase [Gammaproteobacteria bacterium]
MKKIISLVTFVFSTSCMAQQDLSQVEIIPHQLSDNIYYLEGSGGNIGVSIGDDGVFMVDDQFAPLSEKILDAIEGLSDQPLRFVINTHQHGDHVGGNQNMGREGAVIVAHENVRTALRAGFNDGDLNQALSADHRIGLPIMTFTDSVDFHLNGEDIHIFYNGSGHTNGDSFVYFKNNNIIHTGDVFRTVAYPRVDVGAGGTFHGIVASYEKLLEISNANTRFLPGHGVVSSRADVQAQLLMFMTIRTRVLNALNDGMSLEQVLAAGLTAEYDARWGDPVGMLTAVYTELSSQ